MVATWQCCGQESNPRRSDFN